MSIAGEHVTSVPCFQLDMKKTNGLNVICGELSPLVNANICLFEKIFHSAATLLEKKSKEQIIPHINSLHH